MEVRCVDKELNLEYSKKLSCALKLENLCENCLMIVVNKLRYFCYFSALRFYFGRVEKIVFRFMEK